jgi:hypothetical protein
MFQMKTQTSFPTNQARGFLYYTQSKLVMNTKTSLCASHQGYFVFGIYLMQLELIK